MVGQSYPRYRRLTCPYEPDPEPPDGSKMSKIHRDAKVNQTYPGEPLMPVSRHDVDFMVKDNKRFPDGHGWGNPEFEVVPASNTFRVGHTNDEPPQAHDATRGMDCHERTKKSRLRLDPRHAEVTDDISPFSG